MGFIADILPLSDTADKFIGATLVALKPVNVYNSPNGVLFKSYKAGQTLGTIFSYLSRADGVWWQLDNGKFVKHLSGIFDKSEIDRSLELIKTQNKASDQSKALTQTGEAISNGISKVFGFLKYPLILAIVVGLVFVFIMYKKKYG